MNIATAIKAAAATALLPTAARAHEFPAGRETVSSGVLSATLSWDRGASGPRTRAWRSRAARRLLTLLRRYGYR